jgi:hypothetical protein
MIPLLRRLALAAALAGAALLTRLPADVLVLTDGKRVEGEVTEEGDGFTVKTRYGSLSVPKSQVQEVIRGAEKAPAPDAPPATPPASTPPSAPATPSADLLAPPSAPTAPPRPVADPGSGLVAHYPFDGDATDASGNGHHGTVRGATPSPDGRIGGALAFAPPAHVALPAAVTAGLKQFTIALWMRTPPRDVPPPTAFWQHPTLVGVGTSGSGSQDFGLFVLKGRAGYFHGLAPERDVLFRSDVPLADDAWHHVAFVNDGAHVRLLVDGHLVRGEIPSAPGTAQATSRPADGTASGQGLSKHPVCVGAASTAELGMSPVACFYQGLIDDVRIWSRALDPAEIAALVTKASDPVVRLPEPEADALKAAEKEIRDLYKAEYAKKTPADQATLAAELFKQASKEKDVAVRFVLLRESRDLAAGAGDAAAALAAVDRLDAVFAVDAVAMKAAALAMVARSARTPEAAEALAAGCLDAVDGAVDADQYDTAMTLLSRAETAARQAQNPSLLAQAQARRKEVEAARGEYAQVRDDFKTLSEKPDDPPANLQAGRYVCLVKGDWERGLPMLARGSDAALKALAEKELAAPDKPDAQAAVGDAWWDAAASRSGSLKARMQARAAHWYARALPGVTGLTRARLESRLESAQAATAGSDGGIPRAGLVFWVEPGRAPAGDEMRDLVTGARPSTATCTLAKSGVKALVFAQSEAEYPASPAVQAVAREGTLLAWIRPDPGENNGGVLDRHVGNHDDVSLWIYGGRIAECINWPETNCWPPKLYSESRHPPGRWTLAGFTWDAKSLTFHVDGKPDGAHPLPAVPKRGGTVVNLGSNPAGGREFYHGAIGAAMIYNRALRPSEILALYQAGRSRFPEGTGRTAR